MAVWFWSMNEFFFFRRGLRLRLAPFDRSKTPPVMSHSDWPSSGAVWFIKSELSKSSPNSSSLELHWKNHKYLHNNWNNTHPWWWIHSVLSNKISKKWKLNLEFRTNSNFSGRQNIWIFENFILPSLQFSFSLPSVHQIFCFWGFKNDF